MITAVDSNVLLDVFAGDPKYGDSSRELLRQALHQGALVISDVVYAEIAPQFDTQSELNAILKRLGIELRDSGADTAYAAGRKWGEYRKAGGTRTRLLADFLIGAHAHLRADRLLTRDRGFYHSYFPELQIQEP